MFSVLRNLDDKIEMVKTMDYPVKAYSFIDIYGSVFVFFVVGA